MCGIVGYLGSDIYKEYIQNSNKEITPANTSYGDVSEAEKIKSQIRYRLGKKLINTYKKIQGK